MLHSVFILNSNARILWSIQMCRGKSVSKQCAFTGECNTRSAHTNWRPCRSSWHGRRWFRARQVSFTTFGQTDRSSDTRSVPDAIQGVSHFARTILFRCHIGRSAAIPQRENTSSGGFICRLTILLNFYESCNVFVFSDYNAWHGSHVFASSHSQRHFARWVWWHTTSVW